jgi:hypothetical protein
LLYRFGMTRAFLLGFVLLTTACGSKSPESLCANMVPPPAACNTTCVPTAANSCPAGYHCAPDGKCDAFCTAGGNQCGDGYICTTDGQCMNGNPTACSGRACDVEDCGAKNMPLTTITGTVFAPNGTLPLFGVSVYVPNKDPGAFAAGVECGSCAKGLPGEPIVTTVTDDKGNFSLQGVPSGSDIPVVITIGKWRRQIKVATVASCTSQALAATDTRLPSSRTDMTPNTTSVDLPQIAISTGSADSLECLVRRLGISDTEITTDTTAGAKNGRIHLFSDKQSMAGEGANSFETTFGGGSGSFSDSQTLWGNATDPGKLSNYDIVILSCEGAQHFETKPQQAMDHLKAYADVGGRVFLSHWHNIWLEGSTQAGKAAKPPTPPTAKPTVWAGAPGGVGPIATFDDSGTTLGDASSDTIDEINNPKGMSFANWMMNVQNASPLRDQVLLENGTGKRTATDVDASKGERWVYFVDPATAVQFPQNFQFSTPNEAQPQNRCGKVVFSDMHVSGGPAKTNNVVDPYPKSCGPATDLSDQEKALAFMFFDISSCVGVLF